MEGKKLGRRPEDRSRLKVQIARFFIPPVPVHPLSDIDAQGLPYKMDHNDEVGCCVVAGVDHALQAIDALWQGKPVTWTDDFMLRAYQSQNPGFTSWADAGSNDDQGMVVAQFLDWCIKEKLILAYGQLDTSNLDELKAAVYIGGAIITGETVRRAQMNSKVWDFTPNSPVEGGHCTTCVWYPEAADIGLVSWGDASYQMTQAFIQSPDLDEAYMVITPAHLAHPGFRSNFDLAGFAAAYTALTGKPFPVPIPPAPPPAPVPPAVFTYTPSPEVYAHIVRTAAHEKLTPAAYVELHFRHWFKLKG